MRMRVPIVAEDVLISVRATLSDETRGGRFLE